MKRLSRKQQFLATMLFASGALSASMPLYEQLFEAIFKGDSGQVKAVIESGADVSKKNCYGETSLHLAALRGSNEVARVLLAHGADINARNKNQMTSLDLNNGFDVNEKDHFGDTPLHVTARMGHTEIARVLLENGADIKAQNKDKNTPLHVASGNGRFKIVQFLLQYDGTQSRKRIKVKNEKII